MKGGEERRRGLSRGSFRVFPLGLHIGNVQCHIHIPYRDILICFIKYVYFLPSIFCLVIVSAKYRPVKMEEEGWSKNNGIVVGGGRGCKKHRSSYRANELCTASAFLLLPLLFPFLSPSLSPLTRHRCVAQKKQKQRKRDREKGFALSAKKDAWLFSMPATSSDAVV